MRRWLLPLMLTSTPALASQLTMEVEIPRLDVAEYHRPYVAVWLETAEQKPVATLAVWYDQQKANQEGQKWLKDVRQWWRAEGRALTMPVDGVSGATRTPGKHSLTFDSQQAPLRELPAGAYQIAVEAAREVGGREVVRVPFTWPPTVENTTQANGQTELGFISLRVTP